MALRGKFEQVRQIAALLEVLDALAELIASTCRVGGGLRPVTMAQIVVVSACRARVVAKSAMVPTPRPTTGRPLIAAFLDLVSRFTLALTRWRSTSRVALSAPPEDRMSSVSASRRANQ